MADYTASDIKVLTAREAVRKRPGMYFGGVDQRGKLQLLWEVLGNALDQVLRNKATRIDVSIEGEYLVVTDDGPGIPPQWLETVLTTLHAGSTRPMEPHAHISPNLRGIGVACVNFCSEQFVVESCFEGRRYAISFQRGIAQTPVRDVGATHRRGLRVALIADRDVFRIPGWDLATVQARVEALACLNPGLRLVLNRRLHHRPDGLAGLIDGPGDAITLTGSSEEVEVDVALRWRPRRPLVLGFLSQFECAHGTHIRGLREGLLIACRRHRKDISPAAWRELLGLGLAVVVHVGLYAPQFGDPTRDRLANPIARTAVRRIVSASLLDHQGFAEIVAQALAASGERRA